MNNVLRSTAESGHQVKCIVPRKEDPIVSKVEFVAINDLTYHIIPLEYISKFWIKVSTHSGSCQTFGALKDGET